MGANLKEVRERIKSVMSTQQITKAMKLVSAAKLRRAQDAISKIRPYSSRLNAFLLNILANDPDDSLESYVRVLENKNPAKKVLLVVVTSNRGLCGAFNTNIIKRAVDLVENTYAEQRKSENLTLLFIGKKGYDFFRKRYFDIPFVTDHLQLFNDLSFENVSKTSAPLVEAFLTGRYDEVKVVYGKFKNAALQEAEATSFLPIILPEQEEIRKTRANYIYEPGKEELLSSLVPNLLQVQFLRFLLDTHASEHGARMTAMDKATDNAGELLKELKINYNKARQEAITNELSEIVGGAAALGG
jgi:F-type H+-transporting ATPase subunit gamma